jgi:hypothetical protein
MDSTVSGLVRICSTKGGSGNLVLKWGWGKYKTTTRKLLSLVYSWANIFLTDVIATETVISLQPQMLILISLDMIMSTSFLFHPMI